MTNSISRPTASDTANTGPSPAHTNTHIDISHLLLPRDVHVTVYVNSPLLYSHGLMADFHEMSICLCSPEQSAVVLVHQKSIPSIESQRGDKAVMCKAWILKCRGL